MKFTALALLILVSLTGVEFALAQESAQSVLGQQLLDAVGKNDITSVRRLLEKGANIETAGQNGSTALAIAAEHGNVAMVNLLLEKGANVDAKDRSDETPLLEAAPSGHVEIVGLLLPRVSDRHEKNRALFAAVEGGPVVIQMQDAEPKPENGPSPTQHWEDPWLKTVKLLLDGGANLEAKNEDGSTPLMSAAGYGQTDIFTLLLERGANIQTRDKRGNTALILAACECALATMNGTYDIVKILIEKGADVNARNRDGQTALILASGMQGDPAILKILLESGADPRVKDKDGDTALALAMKSYRDDKVEVLKQATAH